METRSIRQVGYRNYLLVLLMVILAFNFVDRLVLGIVLQDVKTDLNLTDTQLGLLTGIAFAVFYATMGIPIARWADRGNRVTIITVTTVLWSVAVALCGAATSFVHLMLIRVAAAVGEAGCLPPAQSLIGDYFSRAERPRAIARYLLGVPVALTIGYSVAGWLNELYGWRATFVILGLPGLVLAALARLTLQEPRRIRGRLADVHESALVTRAIRVPSSAEPSFREVCVALWASAAFRHLLICFSVWTLFGYGLVQWQPAFFIRSHGLKTGELGTWFALVHGLAGGLGTFLGGELSIRYAAGNERLQLRACVVAFAFFAIFSAYAYLARDHRLAFGALALAGLGGNMVLGPIYALIQTLVVPRMRASAVAIVLFFSHLIGMGLGPLTAGILSDALRPALGDESLRYSLVMLCPGYFWAAWHLWRASQTVDRDLRAVQSEYDTQTAHVDDEHECGKSQAARFSVSDA